MAPDGNENLLPGARAVGLPPRPFMYTIDQIAMLVDLRIDVLRQFYIYFDGRSTGTRQLDRLMARNIASPDAPPDWRISEHELVRWMKRKGFKYYERGYAKF